MEAWQVDAKVSASYKREAKAFQKSPWLVSARKNIILAPRSRQVVMARLESETVKKLPTLVYIEPVQIPVEGIFPARALSWNRQSARQSRELTSQQDRENVGSADSAYVMLANFSKVPLTLLNASILWGVEEASESQIYIYIYIE